VSDLDRLCVNAIRTLSIDAVQKANSGHPGLPMGAAPLAYVLWQRHLRHDPDRPEWPDRDRFVLSAGHGSMLLYSLLHLTGYDVSLDDLKEFRQWESITPGHPEFGMTPGVEATTGPLGQGTANAVGMALAERFLAQRYNRPGHEIVSHFTYALVSDGDLMEGIAMEAASLAGHLGLGKLIYFYDANEVTLDGPAEWILSEDIGRRYEAQGWHVQHIEDGDHDLDGIDRAITAAQSETTRPSLIVVKTTIGFGSPQKAGSSDAHGAPLGEEEVAAAKQALEWPESEPFRMPKAVLDQFLTALDRGGAASVDWDQRFDAYAKAFPELAAEFRLALAGELPDGWDADIPTWTKEESLATRAAGGKVINGFASRVPWLLGGDADLSSSTKTRITDSGDFHGQRGDGRNVRYGVREHAMAGIANGLCYHGGVRPFVSTFFVFSDYMRPSIRLAALSHLPAIYVFTHDSVGVGEDGPTHEPVEHLMALRVIPRLAVFRPADANETAEAWRAAMGRNDGPSALVLTRQAVPVVSTPELARGVAQGAYVLHDHEDPKVVILATGSEVHLAVDAHYQLAAEGIGTRVVSMPCWELFADADPELQDEVLLPHLPKVTIEAGVTHGWRRWIESGGVTIGIDRFGASAPGGTVLEKLGITAQRIVSTVRGMVADD